MPVGKRPSAEVDIDERLVRVLLEDQCPDLAHLPIVSLGAGWDNAIYRLGAALVVRLPRRALAAALVEHELRWLPVLAPGLPLPIPAPVRAGRPGAGYPWAWSVVPWLPGTIAEEARLARRSEAATALGRFVAALHRPAPADAPANPFRGVPLADRSEVVLERIDLLRDLIDAPAVRARWEDLAATPRWDGPRLWLHGDLHTANILVENGLISAVIDFGDLTAGDPATDLSLGWMMFSPEPRAVFRAAAGEVDEVDDDTWRRAQAWALALALAYLASSADSQVMARLGHRTLDAVLADR